MELTYTDILQLNSALAEFDQRQKPILNEERKVVGAERFVPYKVGWKANTANARTRTALKPHVLEFEKINGDLLAEYAGGRGEIAMDHPNYRAFTRAIENVLKTVLNVDVVLVDEADLNMEANNFPPDMLIRMERWIRPSKP